MVFAFQCFVNNKPLLQSSEMLKTFFACEMVFKICQIFVIAKLQIYFFLISSSINFFISEELLGKLNIFKVLSNSL